MSIDPLAKEEVPKVEGTADAVDTEPQSPRTPDSLLGTTAETPIAETESDSLRERVRAYGDLMDQMEATRDSTGRNFFRMFGAVNGKYGDDSRAFILSEPVSGPDASATFVVITADGPKTIHFDGAKIADGSDRDSRLSYGQFSVMVNREDVDGEDNLTGGYNSNTYAIDLNGFPGISGIGLRGVNEQSGEIVKKAMQASLERAKPKPERVIAYNKGLTSMAGELSQIVASAAPTAA